MIVTMNRGRGGSLPESSSPCLRPPTSLHQPSLSLFSLAQISQFISCEHILLILCARVAPACYQTVHGSHIRSNTHTGQAASPLPAVTIATWPEPRYSGCSAAASTLNDSNVQFEIDRVPWFFYLPGLNYRPSFGGSTSQVKEPRLSIEHGYLPFMPAMCVYASRSNLD